MGRSRSFDEHATATELEETIVTTLTESRQSEPWPVWAKLLVILVALLVIATIIPWLFITYAMASTCTPMMGPMMEMMRDGMGR